MENLFQKKNLIWLAVILIIMAGLVYFFKGHTSTVKPKQLSPTRIVNRSSTGSVGFTLSPISTTKKVGDTLDIDVMLNSGSNNVSFVDLTLSFDKNILSLAGFTPSTILNTPILSDKSQNGSFRYVVGNNSNNKVTGQIKVGTAHFLAKNSGNVLVTLVPTEVTVRTNPPSDITVNSANATYIIKAN